MRRAAGTERCVDREEVAGDDSARLRSQELPPCFRRAPWRGLDPRLLQDRPDSAGRDPDPEPGELALDPAVAPTRVLARQPHDQPTSSGRGEEAKALKREAGYRARRWVVERTHSCLNRFRRILTRWEKRTDTYLAMLHLACGLITWRATNWNA